MNKINYFAHKLLAGAVALAVVTLAAHAYAEDVPQAITVIKIKGHARYSVDNKSWMTLKLGDVLHPGTVIQTAEESSVDILLGGEEEGAKATSMSAPSETSAAGGGAGTGAGNGPKANIVRITASSTLAIDKLTLEKTGMDEVSETQLDLRAGKIFGNVKKLSAASRYEVKLPNGVAGIRGTSYMISATGEVYVSEGQVVVTYMGPNGPVTQTVSAGQIYNPGSPNPGPNSPEPGQVPTDFPPNTIVFNGPTTFNPPNGIQVYVSPN